MSDAQTPAPTPDKLTATDARGRKLGLRVLDPGDSLDLLEAAGPASGNEGYMRYAMVVASVADVDGTPLPVARTRDQLKLNARKLGNDGFAAAALTLFGPAQLGIENAGADAETAKN